MDELKMVIRMFIFAALLTAATQIKTNGDITIEAQLRQWLVSEPVAHFMNQAAQGGAKFVRVSYNDVMDSYRTWSQGGSGLTLKPSKSSSEANSTHQSSNGNKKTGEAGGGEAWPVQEHNLNLESETIE